jgi:hypothetical protein
MLTVELVISRLANNPQDWRYSTISEVSGAISVMGHHVLKVTARANAGMAPCAWHKRPPRRISHENLIREPDHACSDRNGTGLCRLRQPRRVQKPIGQSVDRGQESRETRGTARRIYCGGYLG